MIEQNFRTEQLISELEIQEQTLSQISQELHDNIGQSISFARMNLGSVILNDNKENEQRIKNANEILLSALNDLRSLSRSMLGEKIAKLGTEASLRNQIKYIAASGRYVTEIKREGELYLLGSQSEIFAFRIVQEALNNIIKHASATRIEVVFKYEEHQLVITVNDNGIGLNPNTISSSINGVGILNMKSRAKLIGGTLNFNLSKLGGLSVELIVPKNQQKNEAI